MLFLLKRKLFSAIWRVKQAVREGHHATLKMITQALTEKFWLLDYWPTFASKQPTILLIKLDLIGDFILWLDAAQIYKRLYPDHKITLVVNHVCVELAQHLPYWDEVIAIDIAALRQNNWYRLKVLTALRRCNFLVAIQPTYSREFVGDLVVRATRAKERIGYFGDLNNIVKHDKDITDSWYTKLVDNDPSCLMELNINAHFVRRLGILEFTSQVPSIAPTTKLSAALTFKQPYIVVAPGASWQPKRWPVRYFASLISSLRDEFKLPVLLCGGGSDYPVCDEIAALTGRDNLHNLAGKTTLLELIELIRGAVLLVSNDSSPTHIAAATKTPSVCVLGGGHYGRFLPYAPEQTAHSASPVVVSHNMVCFGCGWACIYNPDAGQSVPCVSNVPVTVVHQECVNLLAHQATIH